MPAILCLFIFDSARTERFIFETLVPERNRLRDDLINHLIQVYVLLGVEVVDVRDNLATTVGKFHVAWQPQEALLNTGILRCHPRLEVCHCLLLGWHWNR